MKIRVTSRFAVALATLTFVVAMVMLFGSAAIAGSGIITTMDLARLKDIGNVSISPSGRFIVYQIYRANPATNSYSNQWMLVDTSSGQSRTMIADGGDPILMYDDNQASVTDYTDDLGLGYLAPVWSSDDAFYYIRKDAGVFMLHRATLSGDDATTPETTGTITDFHRIDAGHALVVTSAPSAATEAQARRDLRNGFLYFGPMNIEPWLGVSGVPRTPADIPHYYVLDLGNGAIHLVTSSYTAATDTLVAFRKAHNASATWNITHSPDRKSIAFIAILKSNRGSDNALYVSSPQGQNAVAVVPPSSHALGKFVWSPDSRRIYYIQQSALDTNDLFAVSITSRRIERLTNEHGDVESCTFNVNVNAAACTVESDLRPANILFVDLVTHQTRLLSDLNPTFEQRASGTHVQLLTWQDGWGNEVWGKLIYPRNYVHGKRYPLILLTYDASGFQRGGSGDEYPILPLSSKGFFVLNISVTKIYDPAEHPPGHVSILAWQVPLDAMHRIILRLDREGLIDQREVGIGGLSYGSDLSLYAVSHSSLFHAAIASGAAGLDPISYYLKDRVVLDQVFKSFGLDGPPYGANLAKWKESPALQAAQTHGAVLFNAPDTEYIGTLQQYWELRDRKRPVELWIYSGEEHTKHQPAHRLAIYNRNIDWYRFWLQDIVDPNPAKRDQYHRWEAMRALAGWH